MLYFVYVKYFSVTKAENIWGPYGRFTHIKIISFFRNEIDRAFRAFRPVG